jgi:hypothetical protein
MKGVDGIMGKHARVDWLGVVAIGRSSGRGIRAKALVSEGGLRGVGEEVVGRMLSDIQFVVVIGMDWEVARRMRVRVHGLVKVRGEEGCRGCVVRGNRIYGHETVSGNGTGFENLAEFPTRGVRTGRWRRIRRVHGKVRSGIGRETPSCSACHV